MTLRVIFDGPGDAARNMAVDESLFETQKKPDALPTLRFYTWNRPAVTIGYFQSFEEVAERPAVRRLTGGGSVLHGRDLTFSFTARYPSAWAAAEPKTSYLKLHDIIRRELLPSYQALDFADCASLPSARARGGRACFENASCYDLLLGTQKIVGASQRRSCGALLHQCSILLGEEPRSLAERLAAAFAGQWGLELMPGLLTDEEERRVESIRGRRYALPEWIREN